MPRHAFHPDDVAAKEKELRARIDGAPPTCEQLAAADGAFVRWGAVVLVLLAVGMVVVYAAIKAWLGR